jgi:hypothetical protein
MSIKEDKSDMTIFFYCLGLALGIMLGLALGLWVSYSQGMKYAANAVETFIKTSPVDCQTSLGYGNHSQPRQLELPGFKIEPNGSVTWTKQ